MEGGSSDIILNTIKPLQHHLASLDGKEKFFLENVGDFVHDGIKYLRKFNGGVEYDIGDNKVIRITSINFMVCQAICEECDAELQDEEHISPHVISFCRTFFDKIINTPDFTTIASNYDFGKNDFLKQIVTETLLLKDYDDEHIKKYKTDKQMFIDLKTPSPIPKIYYYGFLKSHDDKIVGKYEIRKKYTALKNNISVKTKHALLKKLLEILSVLQEKNHVAHVTSSDLGYDEENNIIFVNYDKNTILDRESFLDFAAYSNLINFEKFKNIPYFLLATPLDKLRLIDMNKSDNIDFFLCSTYYSFAEILHYLYFNNETGEFKKSALYNFFYGTRNLSVKEFNKKKKAFEKHNAYANATTIISYLPTEYYPGMQFFRETINKMYPGGSDGHVEDDEEDDDGDDDGYGEEDDEEHYVDGSFTIPASEYRAEKLTRDSGEST